MNFTYNVFCSTPHWKLIQSQLWISCIYAYRSQSIWFQDQGLIEVAESGCGHETALNKDFGLPGGFVKLLGYGFYR